MRLRRCFALFTSLLLLAVACSGESESGGTKGDDLAEVRVALGARVVGNAPYFVPEKRGWFEENGVRVDTFVAAGGTASIQALLSGDVLVAGSAAAETLNAALKTKQIKVIATIGIHMTNELIFSQKVVDEKKLKRSMPLSERIRALQGLRVGVTAPGSSTDQFARYLMMSEGMDPDGDAQIIGIKNLEGGVGALRGGSIDAVVLSPPGGQLLESQGVGSVIISPIVGDVPSIDGMIYATFAARTADLRDGAKRAQIVGILAGMSRYLELLQADPTEAKRLAREAFPELDAAVFDSSWEMLSKAFPQNIVPTEDTVRINMKFQQEFTGKRPWRFDELVDPSLAEEAMKSPASR